MVEQLGLYPDCNMVVADGKKQNEEQIEETTSISPPEKKSFLKTLALFSGTYTSESLLVLASRPIIALVLPAVFWAALINSVTIGIIVVISTNFSAAFATEYNFQPWKSGLTYISTIIGSLIAIFSGGRFSDLVADRLTRKNNGIRTPEMRLPALLVSLVTGPLACILYGVGLGKRLHWMCSVVGIGLGKLMILAHSSV